MIKKFPSFLRGFKFIWLLFFVAATSGTLNAKAQSDTSSVTIQQILDAHDAYRNEAGVPALSWSNDLADYAQAWANELVSSPKNSTV